MCIGGDGPINNLKHSQRCAYKFHLFMQPGGGAHENQAETEAALLVECNLLFAAAVAFRSSSVSRLFQV